MGLLTALGLRPDGLMRLPDVVEVPSTTAPGSLELGTASVAAGPETNEHPTPRPVADIQKEIDGLQGVLNDRRKLDQEWVEGETGKKLPVPNPVPAPDPRHPKKTRVPRAGIEGSRVGTIRKGLEDIMGDEKRSDGVRKEAARRLKDLDDHQSEIGRLHRERQEAQKKASAPPVSKFDKVRDRPNVPISDLPHPKTGIGAKTPPMSKPATARFAKVRVAIGKLVERGKMNAIPLGKQLANRAPQIMAGIDMLFNFLDTMEMLENASSLLAHGTALPKEQAAADSVLTLSEAAKTDAEGATQDISQLAWTIVIDGAIRVKDEKGLYGIDAALAAMSQALGSSVDSLQASANDLFDRALPIDKASFEQLKGVYLPSMTTVQNANALAMHLSLTRLNTTLRGAAANYREAAETLAYWTSTLATLSVQANEAAWDIRVENRENEIKAGRGISNG